MVRRDDKRLGLIKDKDWGHDIGHVWTPPVNRKLHTLFDFGLSPETWTRQLLAVKSDFSRAIGAVECLIEKAAEMGQCWLRGIATARWLAAR